MRISDWSSDVCSSDLRHERLEVERPLAFPCPAPAPFNADLAGQVNDQFSDAGVIEIFAQRCRHAVEDSGVFARRSEEHTSELQSLMRISYAVFCLKKKKRHKKAQEIITCNSIMNILQQTHSLRDTTT